VNAVHDMYTHAARTRCQNEECTGMRPRERTPDGNGCNVSNINVDSVAPPVFTGYHSSLTTRMRLTCLLLFVARAPAASIALHAICGAEQLRGKHESV
jgi:hypothetical protein